MFGKTLRGLGLALPAAWLVTSWSQPDLALFGTGKFTRNRVKGRVSTIQFPAHDPSSDKFVCQDAGLGFLALLLDGHGGSQVSSLAASRFPQHFSTAMDGKNDP
jgi:hypothetical protein